MEVMKVAVFGIMGVVLAVQFKAVKPEISTCLGVLTGCMILGMVLQRAATIMTQLEEFLKYTADSGPFFLILLRGIGIAYISGFCASICKDAGYQAIALQVEIFGKLAILLSGVPILGTVLKTIGML